MEPRFSRKPAQQEEEEPADEQETEEQEEEEERVRKPSGRFGRKPVPEEPEEEQEEAFPKKKPIEQKPTAPTSPYWNFIRQSQTLKPDDMAAFDKKGDGLILVFTDSKGASILNCSLHLDRRLLDKIYEADEKARK